MTIRERLDELAIELPQTSVPMASYAMAINDSGILYLSGHVCREKGDIVVGRVGEYLTPEQGTELAKSVAIDLLATIEANGGLENLAQVLKLTGYVRSAIGFTGQPAVINGASDLFVAVFGPDRGRHTRAAVGVNELPGGAVVEIDAIVRLQ